MMLVSGGPVSHLLLGPWWPHLPRSAPLYVSPDATFYRPLRCTNRFLATFNWLTRTLLEAEVEEWKHGSWYHSGDPSCQGFGGPLREASSRNKHGAFRPFARR